MNDFSFSVPQNIIVGRGSIARLPEVLKELGASRAFIGGLKPKKPPVLPGEKEL